MKSVIKMGCLIILIIVASSLFFVFLDDEDTKDSPLNQPAPASAEK